MATIEWAAAVDGDFADGADWIGGVVPGTSDVAEIKASGTYSVTSSVEESVQHLVVSQGATLAVDAGTFVLAEGGSKTTELTIGASSSVDVAAGAIFQMGSSSAFSTLDGTLNVANGGTLSIVDTGGGFSGVGTISLAGPASQLSGLAASIDLSGTTIQGAGTISGASIKLEGNGGLLDANLSGSDLTISIADTNDDPLFDNGAVLNGSTIEATSGAGLLLSSDGSISPSLVENLGPTTFIQAIGAQSQVDLDNVIVEHGNLVAEGGGLIQTEGVGATLWGAGSEQRIAVTGELLVNDGGTLSLVGSIENTGSIAIAPSGSAAIRLESLIDFQGVDTAQTRVVTLAGGGSLTLSDNSNNLIFATHTTDTLDNEGNTISGAGSIGGGSAVGLINRGVIDATGVNALIIDVATGKVTNGAHGFLKGSGVGGLWIEGGTFTDSGTVEALDGSSVTFGAGAVITNNSDGTLTGGAWIVTDTGNGAALTLSGPVITTLATTIELSGADSTFDTGSTALESSLSTIAAKGKLELLADRGWSGSEALTDGGLLQLGGGAFSAPGLTVDAGGTVSGFGDVAGPVTNDGVVQAYRGTLDVTGDVSGSGTLKVWGSSTLIAGGTIASSESVLFATGLHATLTLGDPSSFASTISNWALSDTIDLAGTDVTSAEISGDTLAIDIEGGDTLNYTLANPPTNVRIVLSSDGDGGTNLTLDKAAAPAVARLTQAMAALASAGSAASLHTADSSSARLAMIASPGRLN